MLGEVLCIRPRPSIAAPVPFPLANRLGPDRPVSPSAGEGGRRGSCCCHHHSIACSGGGGAASIWHVIMPSGGGGDTGTGTGTGGIPRGARPARMREEGSWNAAWDVRPARWLHGPDSAWMLFGVCPCFELSHGCENPGAGPEVEVAMEEVESRALLVVDGETKDDGAGYRVTGVQADGRCLFRAIVHGACLSSGKEAPDETRQRELADELRAQVVNELLKRRDETELFIDGDFDAYVKSIQQPYTWAGEPELLMASHVVRLGDGEEVFTDTCQCATRLACKPFIRWGWMPTIVAGHNINPYMYKKCPLIGLPISVFMINRSSGNLINVASYGEEYQNDTNNPIKVLFHGYGHYDALEVF